MAKITSLTYKIMYTTVNHPDQLIEYQTHYIGNSDRKMLTVYAKNLLHSKTINKVWLYHTHVVKKEEIK